MSYSLVDKVKGAVQSMLHFNVNTQKLNIQNTGSPDQQKLYKVLVLDEFTKQIIAPLFKISDLRSQGVTLIFQIDQKREPILDAPAIYFIEPSEQNINYIIQDQIANTYNEVYINFTQQVDVQFLEQLAKGICQIKNLQNQTIQKVYDQFLSFFALESQLYSLGIDNCYLDLNNPAQNETSVEATLNLIAERIVGLLATLKVIPIIRTSPGGAAQHIGKLVTIKIQELRKQHNSPFSDSYQNLGATLIRHLLVLFDRDFDLTTMIQHPWTYKPLVQDTLGLKLNKIEISQETSDRPNVAQQILGQGNNQQTQTYEVDDKDFFWSQFGHCSFPDVAKEVEEQLRKYRSDMEAFTQQAKQHDQIEEDAQQSFLSIVHTLPELTERKKNIDKHTNIATNLLQKIQQRSLDKYYNFEEDILKGKPEFQKILQFLEENKGTKSDQVRLVMIYLLGNKSQVNDPEVQSMENILVSNGCDIGPIKYLKRQQSLSAMDQVNKIQKTPEQTFKLGASISPNMFGWADKTILGQGIQQVTQGVQKFLAGSRQAAVPLVVESLVHGRQNQVSDAFIQYDPKSQSSNEEFVGSRENMTRPSFRDCIVFVVGGGNYQEKIFLQQWAQKQQPQVKLAYGATGIISGEDFITQLQLLSGSL